MRDYGGSCKDAGMKILKDGRPPSNYLTSSCRRKSPLAILSSPYLTYASLDSSGQKMQQAQPSPVGSPTSTFVHVSRGDFRSCSDPHGRNTQVEGRMGQRFGGRLNAKFVRPTRRAQRSMTPRNDEPPVGGRESSTPTRNLGAQTSPRTRSIMSGDFMLGKLGKRSKRSSNFAPSKA